MAQSEIESKESPSLDMTVQSDEARKSFGELLARVGHRGERVVITLYGKEHAALVGMKDLERLRALDAQSTVAA